MTDIEKGQLTHDLLSWVYAYQVDRKAAGLSSSSLHFYETKLTTLARYCQKNGIERVEDINSAAIRRFLVDMQESHNPGGVHAIYRVLRAFIYWWERETEPENYSNPFRLRKVAPPRVPTDPLEPVPIETVEAILRTCDKTTFYGLRDRAIVLFLLDTGVRARELLQVNNNDLDQAASKVLIRLGKGRKPREVYFGQKTRQAIHAYLRERRNDGYSALWVSKNRGRLSYTGLRGMVRRRATMAGCEPPSLHSFRRAFALACLRNGMDVFTLQRLMGHSDLQVLRRYLKQDGGDLQRAHRSMGPVDNDL